MVRIKNIETAFSVITEKFGETAPKEVSIYLY